MKLIIILLMLTLASCSSVNINTPKWPDNAKKKLGATELSNFKADKTSKNSIFDLQVEYEISDFQSLPEFYTCHLRQIIYHKPRAIVTISKLKEIDCDLNTPSGKINVEWTPLRQILRKDGVVTVVNPPYGISISIQQKRKDGERWIMAETKKIKIW